MGAQGTVTIDFGPSIKSEASVSVSGQAAILSNSRAEAWIQGDAIGGQNDATAHEALQFLSTVHTRNVTAGSGFTIDVLMLEGVATGQFTVSWVWN
jgi:hypothetical protein